MSKSILLSHRNTWRNKPILRRLYTDWYNQISNHLTDGLTLELGGGSGNLKEFAPNVICTDIVTVPWLDAVVNAQKLPFKEQCLNNIVLFDVLHHLENPRLFFQEACRTLHEKGRIIIIDPYISFFSWPIYNFIHPEPVEFRQNPLTIIPESKTRKPFDANQAITQLIFEKHYSEFIKYFPNFGIIYKKYMSYFVYPLSGGFDKSALIPDWLASKLMKFEKKFDFFGKFLAFRIFIVLEKFSTK